MVGGYLGENLAESSYKYGRQGKLTSKNTYVKSRRDMGRFAGVTLDVIIAQYLIKGLVVSKVQASQATVQ